MCNSSYHFFFFLCQFIQQGDSFFFFFFLLQNKNGSVHMWLISISVSIHFHTDTKKFSIIHPQQKKKQIEKRLYVSRYFTDSEMKLFVPTCLSILQWLVFLLVNWYIAFNGLWVFSNWLEPRIFFNLIYPVLQKHMKKSHYVIGTNVLDCNIIVSKFELLLHFYIYFRTNTMGKVWTFLSPSCILLQRCIWH